MYRDRSISVHGTWEQAHNTYLEIFQGTRAGVRIDASDERPPAGIALRQGSNDAWR
jgi:hypothetical protein